MHAMLRENSICRNNGKLIIPQIENATGMDKSNAEIGACAKRGLGAFTRDMLLVECKHRLPDRGRALTKARKRIVAISAFAAGFSLVLASVVPAAAQRFDPFFAPWGPPLRLPLQTPLASSQTARSSPLPQAAPRTPRSRAQDQAAWPADKGKIEGPYQIVVSIAKQQVALYGQDGLIARAGISTGRPAHPTPMGVFSVLSKARWHRSNIYSDAPMPYMQRITWSGIALHAGPRPGYPASHGCIRLPAGFAVHLFHTTKVGTRVVVTRDAVAPVAIASPKLFVPKLPDDKAPPATVAAAATGKEAVSLAARSATAIKTARAETLSRRLGRRGAPTVTRR